MSARIVYGMPRSEYDADPSVRWSCLRQLGSRSPAHYRLAVSGQGRDTDALKVGRAIDCRVFEPEDFAKRFAVWGLKKEEKVRNGGVWEAFKAAHAGLEILTDAEATLAKAVGDAVREGAGDYVSGGHAQAAIFWEHDGHKLKSLVDYLIPGKWIVDLKTTENASPKAFARSALDYGYLGQAAFYTDAVEAATGQRLPFVLLAAEKSAPWLVQPYVVPPALISMGRQEYRKLLVDLRFHEETDSWPGYGAGVMELELPAWVETPADTEPNIFD